MLGRRRFGRRAFSTHALSLTALAALALGALGCNFARGLLESDVTFPVAALHDGAFKAWSELSFDGADVSSVDRATLIDVVLTVTTPADTGDVSFLRTLEARVVSGSEPTLVATGDSFPVGQQRVRLDVKYKDDLRPMFANGDTIKVEWTGATNPDFHAWPAGGFVVNAHLVIDVK